jgi:hypothetical protein
VTSSGANLEPCGANAYNDGSAKACTTCPWPQTFSPNASLTSVAQCACRPGYERVGGAGGADSIGGRIGAAVVDDGDLAGVGRERERLPGRGARAAVDDGVGGGGTEIDGGHG